MNYRKVYMKIVLNAKKEQELGIRKKKNGNYYERHHILPRSLFPLWEDKKSNLVLLTAREHYFCHELLVKIYPCSKMQSALWIMHHRLGKPRNGREYERLKIEIVKQFNVNKRKNANPFPGAKAAAKVNSVIKCKPVICIETGNIYKSVKTSGSLEGVSPASVLRCLKGRYTRVKGFTYRYLDKEG